MFPLSEEPLAKLAETDDNPANGEENVTTALTGRIHDLLVTELFARAYDTNPSLLDEPLDPSYSATALRLAEIGNKDQFSIPRPGETPQACQARVEKLLAKQAVYAQRYISWLIPGRIFQIEEKTHIVAEKRDGLNPVRIDGNDLVIDTQIPFTFMENTESGRNSVRTLRFPLHLIPFSPLLPN